MRFSNPFPVISGRSSADSSPGLAAQTAGIALTIRDAPALLAPEIVIVAVGQHRIDRDAGDQRFR